jgi:outer membrane protein assembly factor BamB
MERRHATQPRGLMCETAPAYRAILGLIEYRGILCLMEYRGILCLILALVILSIGGDRSPGQQWQRQFAQIPALRAMQRAGERPGSVDGVFLPVDRETALKLERAREMLAKGQVADAVVELDRILDRREDYFFKPDPKQTVHRSLKAEAQRLLGSLDADQRRIYELQFGAKARQLLDDAAHSGSLAPLAETVRRYLHTDAGYEAAILLARRYSDHNQPLAAALVLARLKEAPAARAKYGPNLSLLLAGSWLRAGMKDKALAELSELARDYSKASLELGGKRFEVGPVDANLGELATIVGSASGERSAAVGNWAMPGGNAARNAAMTGGSPLLNERWSASVFYSTSLVKEMVRQRKQFVDSGRPIIPSAQPLAVGNLVLMRTPSVMYGIDFETGKLLWPWPTQYGGDEHVNAGRDAAYLQTVSERTWENNTYGTMTSDGERVFLVHEGDIQDAMRGPQRTRSPRAMFMPNGAVVAGFGLATHNVLSAHSLRRQGAIEWEVGGSESESEPELAGAYFLGPPLPLQGELFALAEIKGGISLVAIDAATGKLEWMQQLAMVELNVLQDPTRRMSGASPSFADGVLVCPTSAGAVVAVDLATRSLLWGYQYPRTAEQERLANQRAAIGWNGNGASALPVNPGSRWSDSSVILADGRVYVTAVESDQLHCLNLMDGKELWSKKRDGGLYVAAVDGGRLLVVRDDRVELLKATGEKVESLWTEPLGAGRPSGRGFYSGNFYYLPLSSAEVVKFELSKGDITARARSRSGAIPGNLICYQGYVISQGVDSLDKYFQIGPLRKRVEEALAANPGDPEALAWRGEIALDDGNLEQAVKDLRAAYGYRPRDDAKLEYLNRLEAERLRTRSLLIDALTASLRADFSGNRSSLAELEAMIETDEERGAYLRVLAAGLQSEGKTTESLTAYLQLADLKSGNEPEDVEVGREVRRDRWISARLEQLWKSSPAAGRAAIDSALAARLADAEGAATVANSQETRADRLRKFLQTFAFHPLADAAREKLIAQLGDAESALEREQLLLRLEKSSDRQRAAAAVARLASLYESAGREREAAIYYRKLQSELADVACLDRKTGKELVAALPADHKVRRAMDGGDPWPIGLVKSEEPSNAGGARNQNNQQYWNVELRGDLGPFYQGRSVQLDQQMFQLVGRDELGRESFRLVLNEASRYGGYFFGYNANHAVVDGHLLVMNTGFQVLAINTLRPDKRTGAVVWREDVVDLVQLQMQQMMGLGGFNGGQNTNPWGQRRMAPTNYGSQPAPAISPIIDGGVAILRGRELSFVDALTGQPLWVRQNVPPESEIYGDSEVLIVAAGGNSAADGSTGSQAGRSAGSQEEALVLRTRDGELIAKVKAPPPERRWATHGRNLLTWHDRGRTRQLVLKDLWTDKEIVLGTYPATSRGTTVGGDAVAIYDASGKFVVHSLIDGGKLLEAAVEPDEKLHNIYVQRTDSQYLLVSNRPRMAGGPAGVQYQPAIGDPYSDGFNNGLVCGRVYAFDRKTGEGQWQIPALLDMHGYVYSQGPDLPVLVFVRQKQSGNQMKISMLCLDKRTGRAVYQRDDINGQAYAFEAVGNPDERTVTLQIPAHSTVLRFTDRPVAPEPPYQAGVEPPRSRATSNIGRLLRILGEAAEQLNDQGMPIPPPAVPQFEQRR